MPKLLDTKKCAFEWIHSKFDSTSFTSKEKRHNAGDKSFLFQIKTVSFSALCVQIASTSFEYPNSSTKSAVTIITKKRKHCTRRTGFATITLFLKENLQIYDKITSNASHLNNANGLQHKHQ